MLRRNREESFEREVLRHLDAAFNLARWIIGNDEDAEDAVQEACVRALRGYDGLRSEEAKPWFLAIVRNSCMNTLRSRNRRAGLEMPDEEAMLSAIDCSAGPEKIAEIVFDAERLMHAMEALPAIWREAIVLREFEQMSYREIAEITQVPIGTVMSRLARAKDGLCALLAQEVTQ